MLLKMRFFLASPLPRWKTFFRLFRKDMLSRLAVVMISPSKNKPHLLTHPSAQLLARSLRALLLFSSFSAETPSHFTCNYFTIWLSCIPSSFLRGFTHYNILLISSQLQLLLLWLYLPLFLLHFSDRDFQLTLYFTFCFYTHSGNLVIQFMLHTYSALVFVSFFLLCS